MYPETKVNLTTFESYCNIIKVLSLRNCINNLRKSSLQLWFSAALFSLYLWHYSIHSLLCTHLTTLNELSSCQAKVLRQICSKTHTTQWTTKLENPTRNECNSINSKHAETNTVTDCGVWNWPAQCFAIEKADLPLLVTTDRYIPFKNTLGWNALAFRACEITQLFSPVICVVIT